jgi:hypothetical protein
VARNPTQIWKEEREAMTTEKFGKVSAVRSIEQSPLSDDPAVPKGLAGYVQDFTDDYYFVDFGEPFGVVCCAANEIN